MLSECIYACPQSLLLLTAGITDLDTGLTDVYGDDFPHFQRDDDT
jgi:hypothetical protein